jgi:cytoplasmic tRNA 2-thiolation protein 2
LIDCKMLDRTDEIRQAMASYKDIELVPLRIQDAFDSSWWSRNFGTALPEISVDLTTEGATKRVFNFVTNNVGRRPNYQ